MDGSHGGRIGVTKEEQYMETCVVIQRQQDGGVQMSMHEERGNL